MIEKEAEVVVIGGGISGCAIAYNLAKRGTKVVLLEKDTLAYEASGRTWGYVRQQGRHACEIPLMQESIKLWAELSQELNSEVDFIRGGNLLVAESEKDVEQFEESVKVAQGLGLNSTMVTPQRIQEIVPFLKKGPFIAGMWCPEDGHADPHKAVNAFANAAREYGAQIYTHCPVQGIELSGDRISHVVTDMGEIKTPILVCAAGVWAGQVAKMVGVEWPARVIRVSVARTKPVEPMGNRTAVWGPRLAFRQTGYGSFYMAPGHLMPVDHDIRLDALRNLKYWAPKAIEQRRLLRVHLTADLLRDLARSLPGSPTKKRPFAFSIGLKPTINYKQLEYVRRKFYEYVPSLAGIEIEHRWAGLIDLMPDAIPVLGETESPKGFIMASGFTGHGFALGPIVGRLISQLILDGKPSLPLDAFRHSRFAEGRVSAFKRLA
ncbi:MAG: FAD-dependent oxidoreductase [Dehalococcoidia bacterium]